jgi:hypothetical protein
MCVNVQTDPNHCGACNMRCTAPTGGSTTCEGGMCRPSCTGSTQIVCGGACVDAQSSTAHCGRCDNACPTPANGTAACTNGTCGVGTCNPGFANCDGNAANGCETNLNDTVAHCGRCGNACPTPANGTAVCTSGTCGVGTCNPGFANCDGNAANGCETNLNDSTTHCGRCGNACPTPANGTAVCTSGTCGVGTCNPGFANCDGNAANGCETNLNDSTAHCGRCGNACPTPANGTAACTSGTCGVGTCNPGFANCDGNAANGCETNLNDSTAHCGRCGNSCGPGVVCTAGICGSGSVRAGSGELGHVQVDPDRDEVYFTQRSPGILFRMRMDGTGLTRFAEFGTGGYGLSGLTLTSEAVYVSTYDNYSIERVARVTGAITRVTSTSFQAAGLDHDGAQLWMTDWSGSIHRRPLSGGAITTFATGLPSRLFGFFLGTGPDDRIYLTAGHSGARDAGEIFSLDRAGGDRRRLASLLSYPVQVTADARHVYATNYYGHRGSIARAPRATLEGGARFIGGATGAIGVAVAANRLYWTNSSAPEVRWMGLTPTCPARWAVETMGTNVTLSNGNRTVSGTAPGCAGGVLGSDWRTTGRYYFEHVAVRDGGTSDARCPVAVGVSSADGEKAAIWYGYLGNTSYLSRGSVACTAAGPPTVYVDSGDVMGVAWDASARLVRFYRNGTLAFSCTLPEGVYYPVANHCNDATYHCAGTTNFGEAPFRHAPPSGFGPLCAP